MKTLKTRLDEYFKLGKKFNVFCGPKKKPRNVSFGYYVDCFFILKNSPYGVILDTTGTARVIKYKSTGLYRIRW